jgi:biopolymer transport protein ExbB/TolQ
MKKFYLFALVILSFHALPVGDLSAAAQPFVQDQFLQRQQMNELRSQQQLDQLQREQEFNQAQQQLDQMRQDGQANPRRRPEQLNDLQRQLDQMRNDSIRRSNSWTNYAASSLRRILQLIKLAGAPGANRIHLSRRGLH